MTELYLPSLLFGSFLKIYDDIDDIEEYKTYFSSAVEEFIKAAIWICFTLISVKNINFPIIVFIGSLIAHIFVDKNYLNNDYFKSGMISLIFIILLSFKNLDQINIIQIIVGLLGFFILFTIDHKLFPENSSIKKLCGRAGIIVFFVLALIGLYYFSISNQDINAGILLVIGYFATSVINMSMLEYKKVRESSAENKSQAQISDGV